MRVGCFDLVEVVVNPGDFGSNRCADTRNVGFGGKLFQHNSYLLDRCFSNRGVPQVPLPCRFAFAFRFALSVAPDWGCRGLLHRETVGWMRLDINDGND
jgi:hypothetical protein